ncbi:MAG TPA: DUF11 domain-containing protein [Thermoanaerobaculia bacterium]|nr:DUF11 domain-containing protein [Thermoanaerobaculia bacterium]
MRLFRPALFFSVFFATSLFAQSDIYVTKDGPPTTTAGSNIVYTITVGDVGPDATSPSVNMTDVIPAGLTFVSLNQSGPDTFLCSTPAIGTNGTVTCDAASMNLNDAQTFTLTVAVPPDAANGTLYVNTATVSSSNDDDSENDSSTVGTSTPPDTADVAITKSGPNTAPPDTDATYTITLTNLGPADAQSVSWTDTLPAGVPGGAQMTFVSFNQTSGPAFNCGSPSTTVTCTLQVFPAGSTATFQFVGHIPPGTDGVTFTNQASQTTSNDPNSENDTASTSLTVSSTDVGVTKSAPASGQAGATMNYVITLTNGGPDAAVNARFTDPLSPFETFVSLVQNNGPAATCVPGTLPPTVHPPGETVQCTIPTFGSGQSAQFTVTVMLSPSTPNGTLITNTATASTDSFDSNPNNDTSSASTTISASADLAVVKTGPPSATAGTNISYAITVTNNGPADASSVSLSDALPPGATFVSLQQNSGPAFNCTTGATVTCSIATLTTGSSASFTLTVTVGSGATGTLSNSASGSSVTADSNAGNNSSTATTTVTTSADVSITKMAPAAVAAGSNLSYTITVANSGPSDAATVSFTDTLPAGTSFVSENQNSGPAFNCTTGASVTCSIASLINGATAQFTIVTNVSNSVANNTTISNTAVVTSATADPNAANNTSTANTLVSASADLAVTKTGPATPTAVGFDITYTITAVNNGPSDAFNVTLTDTMPANTTFASLSQTSGPSFNCTTGATVTCTIATFTNGASATFQLTVQNSAPGGTTVTNTATISSTTSDPNSANNSSSSPVTVLTEIPLLSPSMLMLLALALSIGAWIAIKNVGAGS